MTKLPISRETIAHWVKQIDDLKHDFSPVSWVTIQQWATDHYMELIRTCDTLYHENENLRLDLAKLGERLAAMKHKERDNGFSKS